MKRLLVLAVVFVVFLTGCVQYNEELVLNRNGSGKLTSKMGITDMDQMFGMFDEDDVSEEEYDEEELPVEDIPGIKVISAREYTEDGVDWTDVTLEFETLEALSQGFSSEDFVPVGNISFEREGINLVYRRVLPNLTRYSEEELEMDEMMGMGMSMQMLTMFMGDAYWVYEVTLPGRIIDSNADETVNSNTVKWTFPMTDLITTDTEMWAKIAF